MKILLVILPDDVILSKTPAIKQLINVFNETNYSSVVGLEKVPKKDVSKYGVINIKKNIQISILFLI